VVITILGTVSDRASSFDSDAYRGPGRVREQTETTFTATEAAPDGFVGESLDVEFHAEDEVRRRRECFSFSISSSGVEVAVSMEDARALAVWILSRGLSSP
jgi:hypothetical protein